MLRRARRAQFVADTLSRNRGYAALEDQEISHDHKMLWMDEIHFAPLGNHGKP